jgi:hypothetical protein
MAQNLSGNDDIGRQDYIFKLSGGARFRVSVLWTSTAALDGGSQPILLTANNRDEKETDGDEELR